MDSTDILTQAKAGPDTPYGWIVLPIVRSKIIWGIAGWIFGIVVGVGLFAVIAAITIPHNYQQGVLPALVSILLLAVLLFVALGSAWSLFIDVQRLRQLDKHIIVITPEDFVKQEGKKIIHVPLRYVRSVTARGRAPATHAYDKDSDTRPSRASESVVGFLVGRGVTPSGISWRRKRMRTPTSLAFIDTRTDNEVTVVSDEAYGDPFMIAALLKQYVTDVQSFA